LYVLQNSRTPESDEGPQTATCRKCERKGEKGRKRERDSKHPCDQFAQDDTEMREAVLRVLVISSSMYQPYAVNDKSVARSTAYMQNAYDCFFMLSHITRVLPDITAMRIAVFLMLH